MDRKEDFRRFGDMLWRGESWMYEDPIRRANDGDPFWWAALSIIADGYGGIVGVPRVSYLTDGDPKTIGILKMMPLAHEWSYDPDVEEFGLLYRPSNRTDLGYVVKRVDPPRYVDLMQHIMICVLEIDSTIMNGAREFPDSDRDSFMDLIGSTAAMLSVELNMIGGSNA